MVQTMKVKQPELMNEWGCRLYGEAETDNGSVWWYTITNEDGSIRRVPLLPVRSIAAGYGKEEI